eukprot:8999261-Heterocapsa_arctica.AAC.1
MSWGGKGSGWQCMSCYCMNHHSSSQCIECYGQTPNFEWGGFKQKGKGKKSKGDYLPYNGKGDYPPQGQSAQQGKEQVKESTERKKLGMMRSMLKAAEAIDGWEDKVEELKAEIKEQLKFSNQEQHVT